MPTTGRGGRVFSRCLTCYSEYERMRRRNAIYENSLGIMEITRRLRALGIPGWLCDEAVASTSGPKPYGQRVYYCAMIPEKGSQEHPEVIEVAEDFVVESVGEGALKEMVAGHEVVSRDGRALFGVHLVGRTRHNTLYAPFGGGPLPTRGDLELARREEALIHRSPSRRPKASSGAPRKRER